MSLNIIGKNVKRGENVFVGDYTKIGGDVTLGDGVVVGDGVRIYSNAGKIVIGNGTIIGNGAMIGGDVQIGRNCILWAALIGGVAEFTREHQSPLAPRGSIVIGDNTIIRECVTIHHSTTKVTKVGSNCFLMVHSHVGHDAEISDSVVASPGAKIGGYDKIMEGAYVGMHSTVHQNTTVGAYAMVGMGAVVVKDVPPFYTVAGNPATFLQINKRGMERHGFSAEEITALSQGTYDPVNTVYSHLKKYWQEFDLARNRSRGVIARREEKSILNEVY